MVRTGRFTWDNHSQKGLKEPNIYLLKCIFQTLSDSLIDSFRSDRISEFPYLWIDTNRSFHLLACFLYDDITILKTFTIDPKGFLWRLSAGILQHKYKSTWPIIRRSQIIRNLPASIGKESAARFWKWCLSLYTFRFRFFLLWTATSPKFFWRNLLSYR